MSRSEVSITVVIPVFNGMPELKRCIESVTRELARNGEGEVIVVDNGSTDGSREYVAEIPGLKTIVDPLATVGRLRNLGAASSDRAILCFLDADCEVLEGYVKAAKEVFQRDDRIVATGSRCGVPDSGSWIERTWQELHDAPIKGEVNYINSGNLLVRRDAFEACGGFREDLVSGEDADLCRRLEGRIVPDARISVVHHGDSKTVRDFVRRQVWHGVGMFEDLLEGRITKPAIMLGVHVLFVTVAVVLLAFVPWPFWLLVATTAAISLVVPLASVIYRYASGAGGGRLMRETILYWFYYLSRAVAAIPAIWVSVRCLFGSKGVSDAGALTKKLRRR